MRSDDPLRRYQIMEPLGQGGQGSTFVAIDRTTSERVVVKIFDLGTSRDWKAFERFEREIETLKSLDHPGIPRYIDNYASEQTGQYFLVMSLVPGRPLSEFVGTGQRLDDARLGRVLIEVLHALSYLHERTPPIVHRDIKPANIVLRDDGRATLVDFGGVRRALDADAAPTVVGTFGYMAPEQAQGQVKPTADVYALGTTIAVLASDLPPEELPRDGLAYRLPHGVLADVTWRPVLLRMMSPDPRARFADAAAVLAELEQTRRQAIGPSTSKADLAPAPDDDLALDDTLRELATAPKPVLAVVWVLASVAAGAVWVFEAAFLPLFYQLALAFSEASDKPRLETQRRDVARRVRRFRRQLATLSQSADTARHDDASPRS